MEIPFPASFATNVPRVTMHVKQKILLALLAARTTLKMVSPPLHRVE